MKTLLVAMLVLAMPLALWAQNNQSDWQQLSQLQSGEKISVVDSSHKKHSGAFSSFSDQFIIVRANTGDETIPRRDIREIKRSKRSHRLRRAASGLAGSGVGAAIGYGVASTKDCWCTKGESAGIGAVLGFFGGLAVGDVIPSHQTIYRAARRAAHDKSY